MLRIFIISCFIYAIFLIVTFKFPQKVGNILNIVGIISAEFEAAYYIWDGISGNVAALIYTIIYLLFAVIFCLLLDVVSRQTGKYLEDRGVEKKVRIKNKYIAAILAIFLGSFGAHKFYLGKKTQGALYAMFFFTFIPGIIGIIEGVRYLTMSKEEFDLRYNPEYLNILKEEIESEPFTEPEQVEDVNDTKHERFKSITLDIPVGTAVVNKYDEDRYLIRIIIRGLTYDFLSRDNSIEAYRRAAEGNFKEYEDL